MAHEARVLAAACLCLALLGCGKSNSGGTEMAGAGSPAAPAAAPLTDAQKQALVAELPAAFQGADLANGEAKFALCRSCHTADRGGQDMTGPNLWGIFGRKAGSKPGYAYSDALKSAGWTWDADRIDQWITNPRAVLAGTKMTFVGLADANDRRDVVAYLKTLTSPAPLATSAPANAAPTNTPG